MSKVSMSLVEFGQGNVSEIKRGSVEDFPLVRHHEFGGTPTDIDDENGSMEEGKELEDAEVDEPGLLLTGEDVDLEAKLGADGGNEVVAVGGGAERGGGDDTGEADVEGAEGEGEGAEGGDGT